MLVDDDAQAVREVGLRVDRPDGRERLDGRLQLVGAHVQGGHVARGALERRTHARGLRAAEAGHADLVDRHQARVAQPQPAAAEQRQDARARGRRAGGRAARKRQCGQGHPAASFDARARIPTLRRRAPERPDDPAPGRPRRPLPRGRDRGGRRRGRGRGRPGRRAAARARRRVERRGRRRGLPGHRRAHRHAAASRARAPRSRSPPASRGTRSWPTAWPAAWPDVECLAGIPGSVGATPIQNVGAYGQEVAETIRAVRVLDRADGTVRALEPADCGFTYRSSAFKREPGRWVVLAVRFALEASERSAPIRYPELARALGVEVGRARRRPTCARRCWPCAAARAWSSTPATPTPSRRARSSPTRCSTPAPSPRCRPVPHSAWAPTRTRRPGRRTTGRSRRRPPGSSSARASGAAMATPTGSPSPPSTRWRSPTAARARRPSSWPSRARSPAGVHEAFGVALMPEPVFVGHAWAAAGT